MGHPDPYRPAGRVGSNRSTRSPANASAASSSRNAIRTKLRLEKQRKAIPDHEDGRSGCARVGISRGWRITTTCQTLFMISVVKIPSTG